MSRVQVGDTLVAREDGAARADVAKGDRLVVIETGRGNTAGKHGGYARAENGRLWAFDDDTIGTLWAHEPAEPEGPDLVEDLDNVKVGPGGTLQLASALDLAALRGPADAEAIGDVASEARGSGARYNQGKPPLELIPAHVWMDWETAWTDDAAGRDEQDLILTLHRWQAGTADASEMLAHFTAEDMVEAAWVLDYGRRKYAAWNWAKGMPWSVPVGCILRHIFLGMQEGEPLDAESGRLHWGHVACNVIMLVHFEKFYPEGDDRPPAAVWGQDG